PGGNWADNQRDCDDSTDQVHTGAIELCDTVDNNCDGQIDEGITVGDACSGADPGCEGVNECYPGNTSTQPRCNAPSGTDYYADLDGDGEGGPTLAGRQCGPPGLGFSTTTGDCNDLDSGTRSGAAEVCDQRDNDCDGSVDEDAVCAGIG